jgi:hypothetical protein
MLMEFETDPHITLLRSYEFTDNQRSKNHTLLKDIH